MFLDIPIGKLCVSSQTLLRDVIETIQRAEKQIALVVDEEQHLLGTITDGDVRRAVLRGTSMDAAASDVMQQSYTAGQNGMSRIEVFDLMRSQSLRHIPLVNDQGGLVDLAWISDLIQEDGLAIPAVVMAGGFGQRLQPLTDDLPKPMLPVGDRPLMEHIINQLHEAGIRQVNVTTHYQAEAITEYFGDGQAFGVEINYVTEERPLGTAGALGLMQTSTDPLLVINGDILTRVDFRAMLDHHREHDADMTVAVYRYDLQVPYGVIDCDGPHVRWLREKPILNFLVNAGIYLLEPSVHRYIPNGRRFDMTDLIQCLLDEGQTVVSFPVVEYWLDVGQPDDYEKALKDHNSGQI